LVDGNLVILGSVGSCIGRTWRKFPIAAASQHHTGSLIKGKARNPVDDFHVMFLDLQFAS